MMKTAKELVEAMLSYKESVGRKRSTYEVHLNGIGEYIDSKIGFGDMISLENIIKPWCYRRETESNSGLKRRLAAVREFTKYLFAADRCDGILELDYFPKATGFAPYIFSDDELITIFEIADNLDADKGDPFSEHIFPLIYKLIYFCGLRPNEGRELLRKDFDVGSRTLFIRHNKSGRERIVPVGDDLAELCEKYLVLRDRFYPYSEVFFPAPDGCTYSNKWLGRRFQKIWHIAFPNSTVSVRVYDLRHRFATAVMTEWLDNGENLYTCLPYLSAYMGHAEFSSTAYYIHLLPERLLKSSAIDWKLFSDILPEVDSYE